ncbi:MAG: hypothetical protein R3Y13_01570 [bacterium]
MGKKIRILDDEITDVSNLSLSQLSFIVLGENYMNSEIILAYKELKERFDKNGQSYDCFMDKELEAIVKRGYNAHDYLIGQDSDEELYIKLFEENFNFNECKFNINDQFTNLGEEIDSPLLFSEKLLLSTNLPNSFLKKVLKMRLRKIQNSLKTMDENSECFAELIVAYHQILMCLAPEKKFTYNSELKSVYKICLSDYKKLKSNRKQILESCSNENSKIRKRS